MEISLCTVGWRQSSQSTFLGSRLKCPSPPQTGYYDRVLAKQIHCGYYFGLKVCPSHQSYVKIPTPRRAVLGTRAFGRWLCHEDGALKNGISALEKETWGRLPWTIGHVGTWKEGACYETEVRLSPDTESASSVTRPQNCEKGMCCL